MGGQGVGTVRLVIGPLHFLEKEMVVNGRSVAGQRVGPAWAVVGSG